MSTAPAFLSKEAIATVEGMFRLVRAGDWAGDAALWAEEGVVHSPNEPAVRGRSAIQQWHERFPPIEVIDFSNLQVFGDGNVAYATYGYMLKIKGMPAGYRKGTRGPAPWS
jgi:ketosteroid isomerase-like protein